LHSIKWKMVDKIINIYILIHFSMGLYFECIELFLNDLWHVFPMKNKYINKRKIIAQTSGQKLNPFDNFDLFSMCLALQSCLFKEFELLWSNPQNLIETSFVEIFIFCLGVRELCSLGFLLPCRNTYSKIQANTPCVWTFNLAT
jgi:hypothetical protein